jgi:predicted enzyme related to lactoylglutathione lyase
MKIRLDHIYLSVENMDRAINFYEDFLGKEVSHREENTWADFDIGSGVYFGLINPNIISNKRTIGNNSIPVFWSDDVDSLFQKIKSYKCKVVGEPENLDFTDYPYRCFQFYDTEGNLIEVAKYERSI